MQRHPREPPPAPPVPAKPWTSKLCRKQFSACPDTQAPHPRPLLVHALSAGTAEGSRGCWGLPARCTAPAATVRGRGETPRP